MRPINILVVLVLVAFLTAEQGEVRASISLPPGAGAYTDYTINSITIADNGSPGIIFGNLDPGTSNQPADPGTGLSTIDISVDASGDFEVQVMGDDFASSARTMSIGSVKCSDTDDPDNADPLTTSYAFLYSGNTNDLHEVYFWISIPPGQDAGDYSTTIYFKAVDAG